VVLGGSSGACPFVVVVVLAVAASMMCLFLCLLWLWLVVVVVLVLGGCCIAGRSSGHDARGCVSSCADCWWWL